MTLDEFRKAKDWTVRELAKRLGLHDARSAQRYMSGERMPRPDVMRRIVEVTKGKVGPADFYDLKGRAPDAAAPQTEAA
jgi:transcriptional regulator with XRE-family HTH domain